MTPTQARIAEMTAIRHRLDTHTHCDALNDECRWLLSELEKTQQALEAARKLLETSCPRSFLTPIINALIRDRIEAQNNLNLDWFVNESNKALAQIDQILSEREAK